MSLLLNLGNDILRWFDVIPKLVYFILVCMMSVIDIMQYVLRKLVGLDTYYLGGENVPQTGDIALAFIRSVFEKNSAFPAIKNAFWALMIIGLILLIVTTIIAVIRQEYMPGQEEIKAKDKNNKMFIITRSVKSLFLFLIVPVSAIFGIMLSDIFLQTIDRATSSTVITSPLFQNSTTTAKLQSVDVNGVDSYSFYDIFGGALPTNSVSFSGQMFKSSAYTSNRVRLGQVYDSKTFFNLIKEGQLSNFDIFNSAATESEMAEMIDDAFANNVHFKKDTVNNLVLGPMRDILDTDLWGIKGEYNVTNFSKFNVGLVFYFYDLWTFNYIIGFAFFIVAAKLFADLAMGLAKRLIELIALFIISPPIVAIMPLDEGKAFQNWRKAFIGRALAAYGVILGFNLIFLILPYLQQIHFFPSGNFGYELINVLISSVFVVLGLQLIEGFMGMLGKMIGAEDVAAAGGKMVGEVGAVVRKAAMFAGGAAGMAVKGMMAAANISGAVAGGTAKAIRAHKIANESPEERTKREAKEKNRAEKKEARKEKRDEFKSNVSNAYNTVMSLGFGKKKAEMDAKNEWDRGGADEAYNAELEKDEGYQKDIDDAFTQYQIANGEKSKEEWLKDSASKDAKSNAEKKYAAQENKMTREQFKQSAQKKDEFVSGRLKEARKQVATARQARIANAVITSSGLANTQTIGELFTEEMKDTFVRGAGKGGFPSMIAMFNGKMAHQADLFGVKKKVQKEQMMRTKTQLEVQREQEEKAARAAKKK